MKIMKWNIKSLLLLLLIVGQGGWAHAQQDHFEDYKESAERLIGYWQIYVNILGDSTEMMEDKDRIIEESYLRVVDNPKVQVEDDLDEERLVPYYKDVQAYLKDITFFYRFAQFNYSIEAVEPLVNEAGEYTLLVKTQRNLQGKLIKGAKMVNNTQEVFFEMSVNESDKSVKVISVYATKLNEDEELYKWWLALPENWKGILGQEVYLPDSSTLASWGKWEPVPVEATEETVAEEDNLALSDSLEADTLWVMNKADYIQAIKQAVELEELDLSNRMELYEFGALSRLRNLKALDLSHTFIDTLGVIRNLTHLEKLNLSYTRIRDLNNLQFLLSLKELSVQFTPLHEASTLSRLSGLQRLNLSYTPFDSLAILKYNKALQVLDISGTAVYDLDPIKQVTGLKELRLAEDSLVNYDLLSEFYQLEKLDLTGATIKDLKPLEELSSLQVVVVKNTQVEDLSPLQYLSSLKTVYCDNSGVGIEQAQEFMRQKSGTLVVADSEMLQKWWETLPSAWSELFYEMLPDSLEAPTGEWLHQTVFGVEELDMHGRDIMDLEPLRVLPNLKKLNFSNTGVYRLDPLADMTGLLKLDFANTKVNDLAAIKHLSQLEEIDFSGTQVGHLDQFTGLKNLHTIKGNQTAVGDLKALTDLPDLRRVEFDNSRVEDEDVQLFLENHPDCLVIYKGEVLGKWWAGLSRSWKQALEKNLPMGTAPDVDKLHELILSKTIDISNQPDVQRLEALDPFVNLQKLVARNIRLMDFKPTLKHQSLKYLDLSNNPLEDIEGIGELANLEVLLLENAQIPLFEPILDLKSLKKLNISGTKVKRINGVEDMTALEDLAFFNTRIKGISRLSACKNLKKLSCYNTRVKDSDLNKLKAALPKLEVDFY
ncbi:hypothetical protein [Persicobacter diffluens]